MKKYGVSILIGAVLTVLLMVGLAVARPGLPGLPKVPLMREAQEGGDIDPLRTAFAQAAFRAEYDSEGMDALRRWAVPIRIYADGGMTAEDGRALDQFITLLNDRVEGLPTVSRVTSHRDANITVRFAKLRDLPSLNPQYVEGNWGFFTFWYDDAWQIDEALVLIATDVTSQEERNHLLLEELVGSLGLPNDLDDQPDSIIHQSWTTTQELSELDWQLLNLLYDTRLQPGMSLRQTRRALGWQ